MQLTSFLRGDIFLYGSIFPNNKKNILSYRDFYVKPIMRQNLIHQPPEPSFSLFQTFLYQQSKLLPTIDFQMA